MPTIGLVAKQPDRITFERYARKHGNAVIALLAIYRDVLITESLEAFHRKLVIGAFRFLQTQHIGSRGLDESGHEIDAESDRIDIPGGDLDLHARLISADGGETNAAGRLV
jgi:hypothetical protein